MATALQTCKSELIDGEKTTYALMSVPTVGDRALGVRTGGTATVVQFFALVGPVLISTGAGGLVNADADVGADIFAKQVTRYQEAATS